MSENYSGRLKDCKVQAKDGDGTRPDNQTQLMINNSKVCMFLVCNRCFKINKTWDTNKGRKPITFSLSSLVKRKREIVNLKSNLDALNVSHNLFLLFSV